VNLVRQVFAADQNVHRIEGGGTEFPMMIMDVVRAWG
jgi:hypothetical protein